MPFLPGLIPKKSRLTASIESGAIKSNIVKGREADELSISNMAREA